jgi:signal transduction histidine kinase
MGQSDALSSVAGEQAGQRELVMTIRQRASELLGLSSRLADFSRAASGSLSLRRDPLDIRALVERVAGKLSALAPEGARHVAVAFDADLPVLRGDAACLEQVLLLIGENALHFGSDGEISIAVRRAVDGADDSDGMVLLGGPPERVELRVSDSGIGIPDGEKERVFEPFYRAQRAADGTSRTAGSGLGLAIVQRLIAAHGGTVRVEDNPPRGATLVVTVPASGPPGDG